MVALVIFVLFIIPCSLGQSKELTSFDLIGKEGHSLVETMSYAAFL